MATLQIRIQEDDSTKSQEIVVSYNGTMLPGLAKHYCYPVNVVGEDGKQIKNPQTALEYLANRIVGDLAQKAMQEDEQVAEQAAKKSIKEQMATAAAVRIVVSEAVDDTLPVVG